MNRPVPALFGKLFPLILLCTLCSTFAFAEETLDAFLATPIPIPPIPEETARPIMEKGRSWASRIPARREEVFAYLIPFQRALGAEPAVETPARPRPLPSPTATPKPAPQPKAFLVFKSPEGTLESFKASKVSAEGEVIIAESPTGRRAIWQKDRLATQLPWYSSQELESGAVDLEKLAFRYKAMESTFPALKKDLQAEQQLIQAASQKLAAQNTAQTSQAASPPAQVVVLTQPFASDKVYSREELARILLEAEAARKGQPDQSSQIEKAMAPFQAHFYALLVKEHAQEKEDQQRRAAARATPPPPEPKPTSKPTTKPLSSFTPDQKIELKAEILSPKELRWVLIALASSGIALLAWGISLLFGDHSFSTRTFAVLLCVAPALLGIFADRQLSAPPSVPPAFTPTKPAGENQFLHLLSQAARDDSMPLATEERRTTIRESDLNTFLTQHVQFTPIPQATASTGDAIGIYRTDLAFEFHPNQVILWELSRFKTRRFLTRYRFQISDVGSNAIIAGCDVSIGNLPLPRLLTGKLTANLRSELSKLLQKQPVFENHRVTRLTDGEADLTRIFRRSASASSPNTPARPLSRIPSAVQSMPSPSPTPAYETVGPE